MKWYGEFNANWRSRIGRKETGEAFVLFASLGISHREIARGSRRYGHVRTKYKKSDWRELARMR